MLLAAAHKLGAGLSTLGIAGCGLGIGVVFAGLLISIYFNPIEPAFCDFFIGDDNFNTEITNSPTKTLSPIKEEAPSKLPGPHKKDFLDYALICVGTAAAIRLMAIFACKFSNKRD
jgi:hypothetical protein